MMNTFDRDMRAAAIRAYAKNLVGDCTDDQILFCARKAKVIGFSSSLSYKIQTIEEQDLIDLTEWMAKQ